MYRFSIPITRLLGFTANRAVELAWGSSGGIGDTLPGHLAGLRNIWIVLDVEVECFFQLVGVALVEHQCAKTHSNVLPDF